MTMPVVPNQFQVEKNKIVHKPTKATFIFDTGTTNFKNINWVSAAKPTSKDQDYRKDDIMRVAQQILDRIPR